MKSFIPLTYNIPFRFLGDELRRSFFHELAVNGAEHVVLGSSLLVQLISRPELPEQIASEMKAEGLSFVDSHAPCGGHWDMGVPFELEYPQRVLRLKLAIELAAFFKVRTMTLHLGKSSPEVTPEQRMTTICRTLEELLAFAQERQVVLCLENSFSYRGFPKTLFEIKEKFPEDTLGFCFDAGHANMTTAPATVTATQKSASPDEILEAMLPHIVNCHIHDNDGSSDQHALPGRGTADWEKIAEKLRKAPRLQVIQSEVSMGAHGIAVRELVETFERIFGKKFAVGS